MDYPVGQKMVRAPCSPISPASAATSCCRASSGCTRGSRGALDAVPAAVLTTLVAPSLLSAGPAELVALVVAGLVALRGGLMTMFLTGAAVLIAARFLFG